MWETKLEQNNKSHLTKICSSLGTQSYFLESFTNWYNKKDLGKGEKKKEKEEHESKGTQEEQEKKKKKVKHHFGWYNW